MQQQSAGASNINNDIQPQSEEAILLDDYEDNMD